MNYKYEFQSNFNNEIINEYINKENVDEWGCALVTINDKYGAEYNLCIDDKDNESAIYFQEICLCKINVKKIFSAEFL